MTRSDSLARRWRAARPPVAGLHLDSAACSRQSLAVIDATAQHARNEAEVGGYVAAEAATPALDAGRVVLQRECRVVERHPAVIAGRQQLALESVGGHHGQVGAVLAGQAG